MTHRLWLLAPLFIVMGCGRNCPALTCPRIAACDDQPWVTRIDVKSRCTRVSGELIVTARVAFRSAPNGSAGFALIDMSCSADGACSGVAVVDPPADRPMTLDHLKGIAEAHVVNVSTGLAVRLDQVQGDVVSIRWQGYAFEIDTKTESISARFERNGQTWLGQGSCL